MVCFTLLAFVALVASVAASDAAERTVKEGIDGDGGSGSKRNLGQCPVNGYEIFPQLDPGDVRMKVESTVDEGTCMYEISVSFLPDLSLPYMGDTTPVEGPVGRPDERTTLQPFRDDPDARAAWNTLCEEEGRFENLPALANPIGRPVTVPGNGPELHAGLLDYITEYTYTIQLPEKVKKLTGVDHVTIGAAPCGRRLQPYPHYNTHFWFNSIEDRKEATCITDGGFFCKDSEYQTCGDGLKFNTDGSFVKCDDGEPANIPKGHRFTTEKGVLQPGAFGEKTSSAVTTQGLHALNPRSLGGDLEFRSVDEPNILFLNYNKEIAGVQLFHWAGYSQGHSSTTDWVWPGSGPNGSIDYNCQDTKLYGRLPTFAGTTYDEGSGRTTYTIKGPAGECKSFSDVTPTGKKSKGGKQAKGMKPKGKASKGN